VSIDGDDLFCSPEAMLSVYEGLMQGQPLVKTTGYPFGMNAWGYSCEALVQAVSTQDHGVLETGWGRAFDAIEAKVIDLQCADADKVRATLDYPLDLDFFSAAMLHIPEWQTLSTPAFVSNIKGTTWVITGVRIGGIGNPTTTYDTLKFITNTVYKYNGNSSGYSLYYTGGGFNLSMKGTPWGYLSGTIYEYNLKNGDVQGLKFVDITPGSTNKTNYYIWMNKI
jgi:hypothetical protein